MPADEPQIEGHEGNAYLRKGDPRIQKLVQLWKDFRHGGRTGFARKVAAFELENEKPPAGEISNAETQLGRIEHGTRSVSRKKFDVYAAVLGMKPSELLECISGENSSRSATADSVPWIANEEVLKKYRTVLHHYHQTKQGDKIFWMYAPIDFSSPVRGYLYNEHVLPSPTPGAKESVSYKAYGYLFRQMLVIVLKSDEEGDEKESVRLYHDFRKKTRESQGYFGIHLNEDWNGDIGVGGCLLFTKPFPGATTLGRQKPAICKALNEYWRMLDGERCNRLLHLFAHEAYSRPFGFSRQLDKAVGIPQIPHKVGSRRRSRKHRK